LSQVGKPTDGYGVAGGGEAMFEYRGTMELIRNRYVRDASATLVMLVAMQCFVVSCDADKPVVQSINGNPENVIMTIDDGREVTRDSNLVVRITGEDIAKMQISLDSLLTNTAWELYSPTRNITVPSREGLVTVYGRFISISGHVSTVKKASIRIDLTCNILSFDLFSNSDTLEMGSEVRFVMHTGEDGVANVEFSNFISGYRLYPDSVGIFSRTLTIPYGVRDSSAQARGSFTDAAGNTSAVVVNTTKFFIKGAVLQPRLLSHVNIPGAKCWDVIYRNGFVFLSDWFHSLYLIDARDPARLQLVRSIATADWTAGMSADNRMLLVADGDNGVDVIGINPPESATLVGRAIVDGKARDVLIDGNIAYVACIYTGLWVINFLNPYQPIVISHVDIGGYGETLCLHDTTVFVSGTSGVAAIGVADSSKPHLLSEMIVDGEPQAMVYYEDKLYIGTENAGLTLINVQDPFNMEVSTEYMQYNHIHGFCLTPPYLYMSSGSSIKVLNIGLEQDPTLVAEVSGFSNPAGLTINEGCLYVAGDDGMSVLKLFSDQ
jgi:hypothetical protein